MRVVPSPTAFFAVVTPERFWLYPYRRVLFADVEHDGKKGFIRTLSHDIWLTGSNLQKLLPLFQEQTLAEISAGSLNGIVIESVIVQENPGGLQQ
ncbi:hypothetical protein [Candidatus Methylacidithermus pantelleriae]|uniref:Uncharacterized protein n=1 Tax=Candidatus Methylacidithermus pantelleriae TaxID=2744239 RepID=A0A8J2BJT1_9BACT|nr:hypothetical protein [Candidatus Methylacidithermus pantelleriae]CAF0698342.1 hypothetical protein MPNT_260015 [Candidatus Methylacidithermus pantelleriae]